MKKVIAILAFVAVASATTIAAFIVQPKGQLLGTINQLEAQGYTLASVSYAPILYFVTPTPPYVSGTISVRMNRIQCPPGDQLGPCYFFGSAYFTADEVVLNNNGNTIHTNVSQIFVAL